MKKAIVPKVESLPESLIKPREDGITASMNDKEFFFPTAEINNFGCKNCIWKLHNQCPHNVKEGKSYGETHGGYCADIIQFLVSLAEKGDGLTAIWEKFHIYKARLQESLDYKDYVQLEKKVKQQEHELDSLNSAHSTPSDTSAKDKLDRLKMDKTAAKIWWIKLNAHVIESMRKVLDREAKTKETGKIPGIYGAKTINFNISQEKGNKEGK